MLGLQKYPTYTLSLLVGRLVGMKYHHTLSMIYILLLNEVIFYRVDFWIKLLWCWFHCLFNSMLGCYGNTYGADAWWCQPDATSNSESCIWSMKDLVRSHFSTHFVSANIFRAWNVNEWYQIGQVFFSYWALEGMPRHHWNCNFLGN